MATQLKVTQVRSGIGRTERQKLTLKGLGLRRIGHSVVLKDSPQVRGMINRVQHLIAWEEVHNG